MTKMWMLGLMAAVSVTGCAAQQELQTERQFRQQCDEELAAAKERLATLEGAAKRAEERLDAYKDIAERFRKLFPDLRVGIVMRGGRMVIQMPNEVFFESGSATVSNDGKAALARISRLLKTADRTVIVGGHTDNVPVNSKGSYATNWELSTLRALSVVYFLQEKGMPADKLIAAGFGEHQPIGDNSTDAGKKVNRRIELIVLPTVDEIPSFPERL